MAWAQIVSDSLGIVPSPTETTKFGLTVGRFNIGMNWKLFDENLPRALDEIKTLIESSDYELLIFRCPSRFTAEMNKLKFTNQEMLFTGTLVYWELTSNDALWGMTSSVQISTASQIGPLRFNDILDALDSSFSGYKNHYAANPKLHLNFATSSYRNWADRILQNNPESVLVGLVDGEIAGIVFTEHSDAGPLEVLLAGVDSDFQRRGVYTALLQGVAETARAAGIANSVISTQSENISVQRAWAKAGFLPKYSLDTFHIQTK